MQQCSPEEIIRLPELKDGQKIDTLNNYKYLSDEEKWLIGFSSNQGGAFPFKTAGRMNFNYWHKDKIRIANDLYKIKEWNIINESYENCDNIKATWFIDPPYQFGGHRYKFSNKYIDYVFLKEWCESRNGQVIVCENSKADWMKFDPLVQTNGQKHKTMEVVYINNKNLY